MSTESTEQLRQSLRAEMPVTRQYAYFDHAALAPMPRPSFDAMSRWMQESAESGDLHWPDWLRGTEETRRLAAQMIGAQEPEVALLNSTTAGINIVAEGLAWQQGDNIVTLADEFPSNLYPWMHQRNHGVETRTVETDNGRVDLTKLREACDQRTRLIAISWVSYLTGYRRDLGAFAEIAKQCGAYFFVDAIQGLGAFPFDVNKTPIDFMAAGGQKWMLGPEAVGIAYLPQQSLELLRPIGVGWNSMTPGYDYSTIRYEFRPDAARYEASAKNMTGLLALGASLELLSRWPAELRAAAILETTDYAVGQLESVGAKIVSHRNIEPNGHDPRSGIVAFEIAGHDPMDLRQRCLEEKIVLSCRGGRLRLAAHAYNDRSDVDRLIKVLNSAA